MGAINRINRINQLGRLMGAAASSTPTPDLFDLKGSVIEDGGSYYFLDSSGNGRNFLITNYDWNDRTVKGFPYKSAATISAPAGDAALIAADVNNFLYDSGGNPNQIPVVSLFQNIDYENKFFAKHSYQVLDVITGVEMYEPYVSRFVGYSTALVDKDLNKANLYFVVPEQDPTALVVDVNGGGTHTTVAAAITAATAGQIIYVKTNDYTSAASLLYYIYKNVDIRGIGRWTAQATGAFTYGVRFNVASSKLSGLYIKNGSAITYGIYSTVGFECRNIYMDLNNIGYGYVKDSGTENIILKNCVFNGAAKNSVIYLRSNNNTTIDTCLIQSTQGISNYNTAMSSDLLIKHSRLINNETSTTPAVNLGSGARLNVTIFDNYISRRNTTTAGYALLIEQQNTVDISYNIIETTNVIPIQINANLSDTNSCLISNNSIIYEHKYGIKIAQDTTGANDLKIHNVIIERNRLEQINNSTEGHALLVGYQVGCIIRHNYIKTPFLGIVWEGTNVDNTGGKISYNIFENCTYSIAVAGISNTVVNNNTIIRSSDSSNIAIRIIENTGGYVTLNTIFKNNIIYDGYGRMIDVDLTSLGTVIDNNIYYATNSIYFTTKNANGSGLTSYTFAQWQALGYDTHSVVLTTEQFNNLFTDYANNDFSLKTGSAAIGIGVDFGSDYSIGLDAVTDWDGDLPSVVTKYQSDDTWDIGAYII